MKSSFSGSARTLGGLMVFAWLPVAPLTAEVVEEFVPCKIHQRVKVHFPVRAFHQGILRGEVMLMLEVDRDGHLGDVLAFAHTGKEFAQAALDAVAQWTFSPALVAQEPIGSVNTIHIQFEVNGVTARTKLVGEPELQPVSGERYVYRAFTLSELDAIPKALAQPSPIYPREWILEGKTGAVTLDYFIDERGQTRFPRVVGKADELLGAAAVEAVKSWRFEPPLRRGRPVLAQVRQVFNFRPQPTTTGHKTSRPAAAEQAAPH